VVGLRGKKPLGKPGVDRVFKRWNGESWAGMMWLNRDGWQVFVNVEINLWVP